MNWLCPPFIILSTPFHFLISSSGVAEFYRIPFMPTLVRLRCSVRVFTTAHTPMVFVSRSVIFVFIKHITSNTMLPSPMQVTSNLTVFLQELQACRRDSPPVSFAQPRLPLSHLFVRAEVYVWTILLGPELSLRQRRDWLVAWAQREERVSLSVQVSCLNILFPLFCKLIHLWTGKPTLESRDRNFYWQVAVLPLFFLSILLLCNLLEGNMFDI